MKERRKAERQELHDAAAFHGFVAGYAGAVPTATWKEIEVAWSEYKVLVASENSACEQEAR